MVKETLTSLRKLAKGTEIKITKVKGTDNVVISGAGFPRIYRQLNANAASVSATTVIKARKKLITRRSWKKPKLGNIKDWGIRKKGNRR